MVKRALLVLTAITLAAGASAAEETDPLEPLNRKMLAFNYVLDKAIVEPLAKVYVRVVPGFARTGVRNAINNLREPRTALNQCLQGKFGHAFSDAGRFLVNSTIGLAGLFDPATEMGLERHDEDFGQTLGRWGVGGGPYLMLPVFGPSTLRDGTGRVADVATGARHIIHEDKVRYGLGFVAMVDARTARLGGEAELPDDPYTYLREAYLAKRAAQIADVTETPQADTSTKEPGSG